MCKTYLLKSSGGDCCPWAVFDFFDMLDFKLVQVAVRLAIFRRRVLVPLIQDLANRVRVEDLFQLRRP